MIHTLFTQAHPCSTKGSSSSFFVFREKEKQLQQDIFWPPTVEETVAVSSVTFSQSWCCRNAVGSEDPGTISIAQGKASHSEPCDPSTTHTSCLSWHWRIVVGKREGNCSPPTADLFACSSLGGVHKPQMPFWRDLSLQAKIENMRALEVQAFLWVWIQTSIISDDKNLVTPTLFHMQSISFEALSSSILSPEEGPDVWGFFSKYNNYVLKNITSLYKVGSYSSSKATDAHSPPIWSQKTAGGGQGDTFWAESLHCQSEDLVWASILSQLFCELLNLCACLSHLYGRTITLVLFRGRVHFLLQHLVW